MRCSRVILNTVRPSEDSQGRKLKQPGIGGVDHHSNSTWAANNRLLEMHFFEKIESTNTGVTEGYMSVSFFYLSRSCSSEVRLFLDEWQLMCIRGVT